MTQERRRRILDLLGDAPEVQDFIDKQVVKYIDRDLNWERARQTTVDRRERVEKLKSGTVSILEALDGLDERSRALLQEVSMEEEGWAGYVENVTGMILRLQEITCMVLGRLAGPQGGHAVMAKERLILDTARAYLLLGRALHAPDPLPDHWKIQGRGSDDEERGPPLFVQLMETVFEACGRRWPRYPEEMVIRVLDKERQRDQQERR